MWVAPMVLPRPSCHGGDSEPPAKGRGAAHLQGRDLLCDLDGLEMEHGLLRRQADLVGDADLAFYPVDGPLSGPLPVQSSGEDLASAPAVWLPGWVFAYRVTTSRSGPVWARNGPSREKPEAVQGQEHQDPGHDADHQLYDCTLYATHVFASFVAFLLSRTV